MQLTDSQRLKKKGKTVIKILNIINKIHILKTNNRNPEDNIEKKHARKIRERRMQNEQ